MWGLRKMNRLGALSVWLCLVCLVAVAWVQNALSPVALVSIVLGILAGAVLLALWSCGPVRSVKGLWHALVHRWHRDEGDRLFDRMSRWAGELRHGDFSALRSLKRGERNRFARSGLGLLEQHTNPVTLRLALERRIRSDEDEALASARVFDSMAANSTVVGLLSGCVAAFVIASVGAMPGAWLSAGLAFGFSVVVGVLLSGTVFRPLAGRLRARGVRRGHDQARGMKGLLAIWQRQHPERVRVALYGERCSVEV